MKISHKFRTAVVGAALLGTALGSAALTLGRVRGAVLVGQGLNVAVQVEYDPEEDSASFCFDADVFHADTRQDAGAVHVSFEASPQSRSGVVRVTSSAIINEPVVTVYLRAGCGQKTTRRYVLLADLQSEVESPPAPRAPAIALVVPQVDLPSSPSAPKGTGADASATRQTATTTAAAPVARARRARSEGVGRPAAAPAASARAKVVSKEAGRKPAKSVEAPRLKLEASELLAERDPSLRQSPQLAASPADNEPSRAQSADLWRAINSTPEERVRESQKMQSLEAELKALSALTLKNQETLKQLTVRLEQTHERFPDSVAYGLLALLLASLALLAVVWRRRGTDGAGSANWWSGAKESPETAVPVDSVAKAPDYAETRAVVRQEAPAEPKSSAWVDIDLEFGDEVFSVSRPDPSDHQATVRVNPAEATQVLQRPTAAPAARSGPDSYPAPLAGTGHAGRGARAHDFGMSMPGTLRAINTEELFDIRQQADFFISLGQYDQAIQVLENCVEESGESSPLVYLDLLKIFHTLGRKMEYQQYREDFNLLFNGRVPEFASFNDEGHGLEAYVAVMSRIIELWPGPEAVEVIEACIFRDPGDDLSQSFDLEAYRELLMLHAIALTLTGAAGGGTNTNPAALTRVPFKTYSTPPRAEAPTTRPMEPLPELAIDFDISSPQGLSKGDGSTQDTDLVPAAAVEFPAINAAETQPEPLTGSAPPTTQSGNLIDFDLPDTPARPR